MEQSGSASPASAAPSVQSTLSPVALRSWNAASLDELSQLFANRSNKADGYATAFHAGVAAVLDAVADRARIIAAHGTDVYDNRLLFRLIAEIDVAARPIK